MSTAYDGLVFALHHKKSKKTFRDVANFAHIHTSRLSDFEMGKCTLKEEAISKLYQSIGMKYTNVPEEVEAFTKLFYEFYNDILFYREYKESFQRLCEHKQSILTTVAYPQYLLAQLIYASYRHDILFDYRTNISGIERSFSCLEDKQKHIYYDTVGIHYQNIEVNDLDKALVYFEKASAYGYEHISAMTHYHKAVSLTLKNCFADALESLQLARDYFARQLNVERVLLTNGVIANIYRRMGAYDKAIKIYKECINMMNSPRMDGNKLMSYNNLSWTYLLDEQFDKVIENAKRTLKQWKTHTRSYFYLSYAYERLGDMDKAKEAIREAKDCVEIEMPSAYMRKMVDAFSTYLSPNKPEALKLRKLNLALKEAEKEYSVETQIFVLKIILRLLQQSENQTDLLYYQSQLIRCYEQRK